MSIVFYVLVHADMQLSPSSSRSSRRVRLMYGLASNRFMQRGIMVGGSADSVLDNYQ